MIEINWLAIVLCGIVAMIIGMLWHSKVLFGPTYMKAIGADPNMPKEKMAEIQKKMWQLYLAQFVLVLLQVWVLWYYIMGAIQVMSPISNAFWIWLGFVLPTLAGQWMWSARPRKWAWKGFLISAGYNLVLFIVFALILGAWM